MNVLTFDIEEWALAKIGGYGTAEKYAEYDVFLNKILDALDDMGIQGTFFCTGLMGLFFPDVVKLIHSRGHEIGCHSNKHIWLNKMNIEDARKDTYIAIDALEQCIGQKIHSYRAPAFSIGASNMWMYGILAENGIIYDASVFPAARDFGGFPHFGVKMPCIIEYQGIRIKEFPICTITKIGKEIAYSGGGYFRFFPLWFVKKAMKEVDYSMFYFHIGDFIPYWGRMETKESFETYYKESGTLSARLSRYIKSNIGKKKAFKKLLKLLDGDSFLSVGNASHIIDWGKTKIVKL